MASLNSQHDSNQSTQCAHSWTRCFESAQVSAEPTPICLVQTTDDNLSLGTGVAHQDSLVGALRPAIFVAQLFSLFPVKNATSIVPATFSWWSLRVCYAVFIALSMVFLFVTFANWVFATSFGVGSSLALVFYANAACSTLLFLQFATRWPALSQMWAQNEASMRQYGYPKNLGRKARVITATVLLLATAEHIMSISRAVVAVWPCYADGGFLGFVKGYSLYSFTAVFYTISYAPWKGILMIVMTVTATFAWNYFDLFIMLLSVALSKRFQLLNQHLRSLHEKNLPRSTWQELRKTYNSLALLTKAVNGCLGSILVTSLASDLYMICFQLFSGINPHIDVHKLAYYLFSFGFLIARTFFMMLCAASIHDETQETRSTLYAVPSESYCDEVERFLVHLTTEGVSLTGLGFFRFTRPLTLAVAGTIVTYEIVLMQLNPYGGSGNEKGASSTHETLIGVTLNTTSGCPIVL